MSESKDMVLRVGSGEVRLYRMPFTIGRSSSNAMTLSDRTISRTHCKIDRVGERFQITNLAEKRPVEVNGKPVATAVLKPGDVIRIHDHEFVFAAAGEDPAADVEATILPPEPAPSPAAAPAASGAVEPPPSALEERPGERRATGRSPRPPVGPAPAATPWGGTAQGQSALLVLCALVILGLCGLGVLGAVKQSQHDHARAQVIERLSTALGELESHSQTGEQLVATRREATERGWSELSGELPTIVAAPAGWMDELGARQPAPPVSSRPAPPVSSRPAPPVSSRPAPPVSSRPASSRPASSAPASSAPASSRPASSAASSSAATSTPPAKAGIPFFDQRITEQSVVWVVDKSAKMSPMMNKLKAQLDGAFAALKPEQRFTVYFCDEGTRVFSHKLVAASDKYRALARRFTKGQRAEGDCKPLDAIRSALAINDAEALVLVTSGHLPDDAYRELKARLDAIIKGRRNQRVYLISASSNSKITKLADLVAKQP